MLWHSITLFFVWRLLGAFIIISGDIKYRDYLCSRMGVNRTFACLESVLYYGRGQGSQIFTVTTVYEILEKLVTSIKGRYSDSLAAC